MYFTCNLAYNHVGYNKCTYILALLHDKLSCFTLYKLKWLNITKQFKKWTSKDRSA